MLIELSITAYHDTVIFTTRQPPILIQVQNVMAFSAPYRIAAIGQFPQEMQHNVSNHDKPRPLEFVSPILMPYFDPAQAGAFIRYYVYKIHSQIRPRLYSFWRNFDRFDCILEFAQSSSPTDKQWRQLQRELRTWRGTHRLKLHRPAYFALEKVK